MKRPGQTIPAGARSCEGAVLLEVTLSLLLFVAAVAVVSSAFNASMESIQRQRLAMHAANLASTVHAELDLGLRSTDVLGPEPFSEPFGEWTWQLEQGIVEGERDSGLTRIEVIIRNTNAPTTLRLAQTHRVVKTIVSTNEVKAMEASP